ncbi:hypothetical protein A9Q80_03465 [Cycloclasticus sp. 46_83_sub15_T18]|nr:hypothetical protein A9Q80_03465 [Cycloclasticus sp. 46_83_sub15_T18]OUR83230.1 hypothetical protein A9Q82_04040 [Cycloclasticus sp. 46_120_T64]
MGIELMIGVLIGLGLGFALSSWFSRDKNGVDAEKVQKLETEHEAYRKQVDDHFVNSAVLLKGLTEQYRDVYRHIANGAGDLCSEEAKALQTDLSETALLAETAGTVESVTADEQGGAVESPVDDEPSRQDDNEIPLASEVEVAADIAQELKKQAAKKSA